MPSGREEEELLRVGLQYYLAARSAALAGSMPVTGNLYHHAVEMLLKAGLSRKYSLHDLHNMFWHDLPKIWHTFKNDFPVSSLEQFDTTITTLDKWEDIRYPEKLLKQGARMSFDWGDAPPPPQSPQPGQSPPPYKVNGTEIDNLVITIFEVLPRDPSLFTNDSPHLRQILIPHHPGPEKFYIVFT